MGADSLVGHDFPYYLVGTRIISSFCGGKRNRKIQSMNRWYLPHLLCRWNLFIFHFPAFQMKQVVDGFDRRNDIMGLMGVEAIRMVVVVDCGRRL